MRVMGCGINFPLRQRYYVSFNNAKSCRGHRVTTQPFRKELGGLSKHSAVSVLARPSNGGGGGGGERVIAAAGLI